MDLLTLTLLAIALSMDAFAVSICKGLSMTKASIKNCLIAGVWFGGFQGLMPLIGYLLGVQFETFIDSFSSWIAFILLSFIGGNMIHEALSDEDDNTDADMSPKSMLLLAVATSIDALAVGITFACIPVNIISILPPLINTLIGCIIIAATTCIISMTGVKIGNIFGTKYKKHAEAAGGVILILLGLKILLQYLL